MRPSRAFEPGRRKALRLFVFAALATCVSVCARQPQAAPAIVLVDPSAIEIRNVPAGSASAVRATVRVGERTSETPPVAGRVQVVNGVPRFTPMFPLEAGRAYYVRAEWGSSHIEDVVRVPAKAAGDPVRVTRVFPALDDVPENLLRIYIHFSGPMGRDGGAPFVKILDEQGKEVVDPFLPVEGEFWDGAHQRYTLFFDPGRVKTGILPNERMGRPLRRGHRYTLVVTRDWKDSAGRPLAEEFRQPFRVGPAIARPIVTADWTIAAPRAGSRDPLVVTFPWPLDHALLQRALGVEHNGRVVDGTAETPDGDRSWRFTPAAAWPAAPHQLVALSILEDPSGNRIGRAFEVEGATRGPSGPDRILIPWSPR